MRQSLSQVIAANLRSSYCQPSKLGCRLPPERVLARDLKVSLPTLREALAILAMEGWVDRRHGSGNFIRQPQTSKNRIGILIETDLACSGASRGSLLAVALKLKRRLEAQDKPCRIYFGDRTPDDSDKRPLCPEFLADLPTLDRVVALHALLSDDWLLPLTEQGVAVIGGNSLFDVCLQIDREKWIGQALAHLAQRGAERIGLIYWGGNRPLNPGATSYGDIFASAMARLGLPFDPQLVRSDLHPSLDGAGWEEFREIWLRDPAKRPDGLVVTDDVLLQGCLQAAADQEVCLGRELLITALTSDFRTERDWDKITRFEWQIDRYVELCLRALQLDQTALPARFDIPLTICAPRRGALFPSNQLTPKQP